MKKIFLIIIGILLVGICGVGCGKVSDATGGEVTMAKMVEAGSNESILKNHNSFNVSYYFPQDNYYCERYTDAEVKCIAYADDYAELFVNDELIYILDGENISTILNIQEAKILYDTQHILFAEGSLREEIKTYEEKDGRIYLTTELSADVTKEYCQVHDLVYHVGDTVKIYYELDKETLELLKERDFVVASNGEEEAFVDITVSYDVERIEACKKLCQYMNASGNLRTVTIITDPGTEEEAEWSKQAPMGVSVRPYGGDDYVKIYVDDDCTQELTESSSPNKDVTMYMKRGN